MERRQIYNINIMGVVVVNHFSLFNLLGIYNNQAHKNPHNPYLPVITHTYLSVEISVVN
jgi:hypothetical protein